MSVDIAELGFSVRSDGVVVATDRLNKMNTATNQVMRNLRSFEDATSKFARSMSLRVTAPLVAAAAASVHLGQSFGGMLAEMNTLAGVSRDELKLFRKEILALSQVVGRTPLELADAMRTIASAGQTGAKAIETLTAAAKASAIGMGDIRPIALAATAAVKAYGEANMTSTKAVEILIGTVDKGNVAAAELAPTMGRVIGIAAEMGVTFEDVGAFIATFTRLGVDAAEATTALRGVLTGVMGPTEGVNKAFADLGLTAEQFRDVIEQQGFINAFRMLVTRSRELNVDLIELIPNTRALSGVLGVFTGDGSEAIEILEGVSDAVGTLNPRLKDMQELDPGFPLKQMAAQFQATAIVLSEHLLPVTQELSNDIRNLLSWFSNLNSETQITVVRILALTAAIGPLAAAVAAGSFSIRWMITMFTSLRTATLFFFGSSGVFSGSIATLRLMAIQIAGVTASMGAMAGVLATLRAAMVFLFATPLGLFIVAAGALTAFAMAMAGAKAETSALDLEIKALIESMTNMNDTAVVVGFKKIGAEMAQTQQKIEDLRRQIEFLNALDAQGSVDIGGSRGVEIGQMTEQMAAAEARMATLKQMALDLAAAFTAVGEGAKNANQELPEMKQVSADILAELAANFRYIDGMKKRRLAPDFEQDLNASLRYVESLEDISSAYKSLEANLDPAAAAMNELTEAQLLLNEAVAAGIIDEERRQELLSELPGGANNMLDRLREMEEIIDPGLAKTRELEDALRELNILAEEFDIPPEVFERMAEGLERAVMAADGLGDALQTSADIAADVFRDLQKGVGRESDLYDKLTVAIEAANLVKAIGAVLSQSEGDPYTAFARMAAMAGVVSALVGVALSVGGLSGGFSDTAADRQETQGTGTVLGDVAAKSESIAKAIEITADATSELVGINRGMLHALQSLADGISGASSILARTGQGGAFSGLPKTFQPSDFLPGDIFAGIWDSLLGGSAKVTDEGIAILSGTIGELIDGTLIAAFQEVQYKKWAFGSKKTREELIALGEEAAAQFGLIFLALQDTVREGAIALGMSQELIDARLAAFEVAEQRISLMDLTAEEQAAEIEAVISTIFDSMVSEVVPFVRQFQKVGEGLGETLIRVATSVQVFQEAVQQLGYAADVADPEAFAIMAVGLVELLGGVENFIALFTGFMDRFASDEQKLTFVTDQLTRAFDEVGMVLPETRDGFWALMQSMDATTEEGRKQIALLLQLGPIADQYYSLLEDAERDRLAAAEAAAKAAADALELIRQQVASVRDFIGLGPSQALVDLQQRFADAMKAARALGASQAEYAMIVRAFDRQLSRMAAELTRTVIQLSQDLFNASAEGFVDSVEDGINEVRLVANSLFSEWQQALTNLKGFADSLLLDENLTTLNPMGQFLEAQKQFNTMLAAARSGDVEAAGELPGAAQAFLEEARFMFASGPRYDAIFREVQQALRGIEMPKGIEEYTREIADNTGETVTAVQTAQDAILAGLDRMLKAMDLANALRDLSYVLDRGTVGLAEELGVPLDQLAAALGIDVSDLSMDTLLGIANMAELLGADLRELGVVLGVDLDALATSLGIDLNALMFETQFVKEIDLLGSIFHELEMANLWLEMLVNPFLDNKSKEGPTTAPTEPVTTPQSNGGVTSFTSDETTEIVRLLTELRDLQESKAKADADADRQMLQAQITTNDVLRRTA